ncbi:hypothetical protein ACHAXS_007662 [Conticribra weissflogii]
MAPIHRPSPRTRLSHHARIAERSRRRPRRPHLRARIALKMVWNGQKSKPRDELSIEQYERGGLGAQFGRAGDGFGAS